MYESLFSTWFIGSKITYCGSLWGWLRYLKNTKSRSSSFLSEKTQKCLQTWTYCLHDIITKYRKVFSIPLGKKSFLLNLFLIGRKLLYHVVLVSAIQQCESAISIPNPLPLKRRVLKSKYFCPHHLILDCPLFLFSCIMLFSIIF